MKLGKYWPTSNALMKYPKSFRQYFCNTYKFLFQIDKSLMTFIAFQNFSMQLSNYIRFLAKSP